MVEHLARWQRIRFARERSRVRFRARLLHLMEMLAWVSLGGEFIRIWMRILMDRGENSKPFFAINSPLYSYFSCFAKSGRGSTEISSVRPAAATPGTTVASSRVEIAAGLMLVV